MRFARLIAAAMLAIALTASAGCNYATGVNRQEMRKLVHNDITQVMNDIARAEESSPTIGLSSNPFTYAEISPALDRLVARGKPALDAIADEIESSAEDGLREYLLAIAGHRIMGEVKVDESWSTGKGWARYYRARK